MAYSLWRSPGAMADPEEALYVSDRYQAWHTSVHPTHTHASRTGTHMSNPMRTHLHKD